jgi:hypothetical protein
MQEIRHGCWSQTHNPQESRVGHITQHARAITSGQLQPKLLNHFSAVPILTHLLEISSTYHLQHNVIGKYHRTQLLLLHYDRLTK